MKKPTTQEPAFDSQYVDESGTTAASTGAPQENLPEIETKQYGVGKPRRVVILGKVIREE